MKKKENQITTKTVSQTPSELDLSKILSRRKRRPIAGW